MTFPVTLLMRKRMSQGLTIISAASLPFVLPRRLLLRAPAIALLALALVAVPAIVPFAILLKSDIHLHPGNLAGMIAPQILWSLTVAIFLLSNGRRDQADR